ncbi:MAG: signal peptidase II [Candidatus Dormibacteria bacterium]
MLAGGAALSRPGRRFRPRSLAVLLLTAVAVYGLDHLSKWLVVSHLGLGEQVPDGGPVVIRHVENRGAAFGLFPNLQGLFLVVAIVVTAYILVLGHRLDVGFFRQSLLGAILGGAVANAVDRFRQGYVVDFIDPAQVPVINFKYATFNIADMAIVLGIITALFVFRGTPGRRHRETVEAG